MVVEPVQSNKTSKIWKELQKNYIYVVDTVEKLQVLNN